MSDFSSLDLNKPIDNSSIAENLRQPIWIALIASVVVHAILGINLPRLSLFSEQAKLPPTVGLVELTPEQLERLPQPEEPEITFSTIPAPPNFFPGALTPASELPSVLQSSSELPEIPVDPSNYNLPKLAPEDAISFSTSTGSRSTPSVSRLPSNQSSIDQFSNNYPSTYPPLTRRSSVATTPLDIPIVPENNSQIINIFPNEQSQDLNQAQIDESQRRKELNLTDKVFDSGLSRRTLEIDPNNGNSTVDNSILSGDSYSEKLQLPPRRYQDKNQNQVAVTPNNSNTQTNKTSVATATPEAPPKPDPTKKNRLPEAPLVRRLREGKTMQDIAEETKQPEKVVVTAPPPQTSNSQPEFEVEETPSPEATPQAQTPEQPKEHKGSLLENLRKPPQRQVAETAPTSQPSPKPDQNVAATVKETMPATSEVEVKPDVDPAPKPSPPQQPEENKGSLLQKFEQQKQQSAAVAQESESRDIALSGVTAYTEWALELGLTEEGNLTSPQTISDVYPEAACDRQLKGNALVGVLVSPDGTIERGPKLLVNSDYAVLDEAALDAVSKRSFSSSDRSKLYQYEFNFDSSNCTAAQPTEAETAPTQAPKSEETSQPTDEAIPIEVMPAEGE